MAKAPSEISCTIRTLPPELVVEAARVAVDVYPANAPPLAQFASTIPGIGSDAIYEPQRIAALTDKYWGPKPRVLSVQFLDNPDSETRRQILSHANRWDCGVTFVESSEGVVRITRGPSGYWSYLGTDVKMIRSGPTMNLQGFTARTSESEYRRVVPHEFGHTLGFPHEHMRKELVARLHRQRTIAYFGRTQGWSPRDVELQVLTPLDEVSVMGTPADEDSEMCYQLPAEITLDGRAIRGGSDLNATDLAFADAIYPLAGGPVVPPIPPVDPPKPVEPPKPKPKPKPPVEPKATTLLLGRSTRMMKGDPDEPQWFKFRATKLDNYLIHTRSEVTVRLDLYGPGTTANHVQAGEDEIWVLLNKGIYWVKAGVPEPARFAVKVEVR